MDDACKLKKELIMFKVDFEKAYDSVDWRYLGEVMGKMKFMFVWRKWIMECVTSTSVLVNGSLTDEFNLERGLQQGDPLSPFLFLLVVEGLNVMMIAMVENGVFSVYKIGAQDAMYVTHL